jgi:hypothetical protein
MVISHFKVLFRFQKERKKKTDSLLYDERSNWTIWIQFFWGNRQLKWKFYDLCNNIQLQIELMYANLSFLSHSASNSSPQRKNETVSFVVPKAFLSSLGPTFTPKQSDQIGQIFVRWVTVYFGHVV